MFEEKTFCGNSLINEICKCPEHQSEVCKLMQKAEAFFSFGSGAKSVWQLCRSRKMLNTNVLLENLASIQPRKDLSKIRAISYLPRTPSFPSVEKIFDGYVVYDHKHYMDAQQEVNIQELVHGSVFPRSRRMSTEQ